METVRTTIVLDRELLSKIKQEAFNKKMTQTEFIINCVKKEIENKSQ